MPFLGCLGSGDSSEPAAKKATREQSTCIRGRYCIAERSRKQPPVEIRRIERSFFKATCTYCNTVIALHTRDHSQRDNLFAFETKLRRSSRNHYSFSSQPRRRRMRLPCRELPNDCVHYSRGPLA